MKAAFSLWHAVAIAEAVAIGGGTAVAEATASVPAVQQCATGDPAAATAAARAQAPSLGGPSSQARPLISLKIFLEIPA